MGKRKTNGRSLVIYTDGACEPNPGPGAWGAVILSTSGKTLFEMDGYEPKTTNQCMEMLGPIVALESSPPGSRVTVYSDSQYVIRGITDWIHNWKVNGWRTAGKTPVKNRGLWERMECAAAAHSVTWRWVRGHDGNEGNERADYLARRRLLGELRADRMAFGKAVRGFSRHHDFDPAPYLK